MMSAAFRARIERWSARLKVRPTQIRVQAMSRKWASCSSRGRITFCRDLMKQPASFQDYVIAHELLHLRIPNHGRLFVATLRAHLRGNSCLDRHQVSGVTRQ
jgi:predicted metal-dependent hydrolase